MKIFLNILVALLCVMSGVALATPSFTATVNGTSYDFTYTTSAALTDNSALLQTQPWWGSESTARTFTAAVGTNLGYPNGGFAGPVFAYGPVTERVTVAYLFLGAVSSGAQVSTSTPFSFALATAAVPEIDGALIPQVGFLLAGLFLIFGRKKQHREPLLLA